MTKSFRYVNKSSLGLSKNAVKEMPNMKLTIRLQSLALFLIKL